MAAISNKAVTSKKNVEFSFAVFFSIAVVVAALAVGPRSAFADVATFRGSTMGTTFVVKVVVDGKASDVESLKDKIQVKLARINSLMSTYLSESEVSRFNASTDTEWFEVSRETAEVVNRAREISELSNGAFDITVGPLVALWNFGAASRGEAAFQLPRDEQIAATLTSVGYQKLAVRMEPPAIRKTIGPLQIDLSAIAKGYAVDVLADLLETHASKAFMVEIGGEVRVRGSRPGGEGWRIGVESPDPQARKLELIVPLHDQAMATSGDYRNFYRYDGKLYSHTIDPKSGRPVDHTLTSCSVLSPDCATADAIATTMLVLGPVAGKQWAEEHGVAVLMFVRDGDGITRSQTSQFPAIVSTVNDDAPGFPALVLVSIVVFAVALAGMAIGVIVKNKALTGSCGGLAGMKDETGKTVCQLCARPAADCDGDPDKDGPGKEQNKKEGHGDGECEERETVNEY
ncbi:MAG: thiamine biosynthesis lipoprotein [Pirellulaceae bacterium]|jgi:thiamine biosynthesis lipoprotein